MATTRGTASTPSTTPDPVGPFGPPVAAPRARELRALVLAHVQAEPRRRFSAVLHVGRPGGPEAVRPARDPADDHALRVEVLEAMLRRVRALPTDLPADPLSTPALVWLTRPGPLVPQDLDAAWGAAARAAGAELGMDPLPLVVVTRAGWWEPATGSGRRWRRLRVRR